jgi:predicted kinase
MSKLICPVGIQGCGKSTWTKKFMETHENYYLVNGDALRLMLYNAQFNVKKEKAVRIAEEAIIKALLQNGQCVIKDDMNISASVKATCRQLAEETGAELIWQDFTGVPLDECILRDRQRREGYIGRAIIEGTALRHDLIPWNDKTLYPRDFILVDMDGTLSNCDWRRKLYLEGEREGPGTEQIKQGKKDWEKFFESAGDDEPNYIVLQWVLQLQHDYDIIIVTGRFEKYYGITNQWLERYNVKYRRIFMRKIGDYRADWESKQEMLSHLPKERIVFAIDDRPRVIQMWRANGIKVYPVGGYDAYW